MNILHQLRGPTKVNHWFFLCLDRLEYGFQKPRQPKFSTNSEESQTFPTPTCILYLQVTKLRYQDRRARKSTPVVSFQSSSNAIPPTDSLSSEEKESDSQI